MRDRRYPVGPMSRIIRVSVVIWEWPSPDASSTIRLRICQLPEGIPAPCSLHSFRMNSWYWPRVASLPPSRHEIPSCSCHPFGTRIRNARSTRKVMSSNTSPIAIDLLIAVSPSLPFQGGQRVAPPTDGCLNPTCRNVGAPNARTWAGRPCYPTYVFFFRPLR
jgi:hypothetical protein